MHIIQFKRKTNDSIKQVDTKAICVRDNDYLKNLRIFELLRLINSLIRSLKKYYFFFIHMLFHKIYGLKNLQDAWQIFL